MSQLMTNRQVAAMLQNLPASCVIDAIDRIVPPVSTGIARIVLLSFEEDGIVEWRREAPQEIQLTNKGAKLLEELNHG